MKLPLLNLKESCSWYNTKLQGQALAIGCTHPTFTFIPGICVMLSAGQLMFHELGNVYAVIINMYSMICFLIVDW